MRDNAALEDPPAGRLQLNVNAGSIADPKPGGMGKRIGIMFYAAPANSNASATPYDVVVQFTQALKLTTGVPGRMCNSWQKCLKELESLFGLQDDWDGEGS